MWIFLEKISIPLLKKIIMKTLIAYFSLDGNTKWIAEKLHRKLPNTTLHAIELASQPIKSKWWRMMVYGFKTTFYKKMPIKNSDLDMTNYDAIIIGVPVWAGQVPPPLKAFLQQYPLKGKKVVAFCSMGGQKSQFFEKVQELAAVDKLAATFAMVEPLQNLNAANFKKVEDFVKTVEVAFEKETTLA